MGKSHFFQLRRVCCETSPILHQGVTKFSDDTIISIFNVFQYPHPHCVPLVPRAHRMPLVPGAAGDNIIRYS